MWSPPPDPGGNKAFSHGAGLAEPLIRGKCAEPASSAGHRRFTIHSQARAARDCHFRRIFDQCARRRLLPVQFVDEMVARRSTVLRGNHDNETSPHLSQRPRLLGNPARDPVRRGLRAGRHRRRRPPEGDGGRAGHRSQLDQRLRAMPPRWCSKASTVKPAGEAEALPIGKSRSTGVTEEDGGYSIDTLTTDAVLEDRATASRSTSAPSIDERPDRCRPQTPTDPMASHDDRTTARRTRQHVGQDRRQDGLRTCTGLSFEHDAAGRRQADGIHRRGREVQRRPDAGRGPAVARRIIEALGYQTTRRQLRDGRLLAADRRPAGRCRSTTSRSTMPARSA